jgi:uncharacterized membrane protein
MTLFLAHVGATLMMAGLIWLVQLVHYPLFAQVGEQTFRTYHVAHNQLITPIVGPLMLVELLGALMLCVERPATIPAWAAWSGLGLVGVAWITTALFSVPAHSILAGGFDEAAHRALVSTNWLRTIAWSAHGALVLYQVSCLIDPKLPH